MSSSDSIKSIAVTESDAPGSVYEGRLGLQINQSSPSSTPVPYIAAPDQPKQSPFIGSSPSSSSGSSSDLPPLRDLTINPPLRACTTVTFVLYINDYDHARRKILNWGWNRYPTLPQETPRRIHVETTQEILIKISTELRLCMLSRIAEANEELGVKGVRWAIRSLHYSAGNRPIDEKVVMELELVEDLVSQLCQ